MSVSARFSQWLSNDIRSLNLVCPRSYHRTSVTVLVLFKLFLLVGSSRMFATYCVVFLVFHKSFPRTLINFLSQFDVYNKFILLRVKITPAEVEQRMKQRLPMDLFNQVVILLCSC